jgi:triosephosphate isomerase
MFKTAEEAAAYVDAFLPMLAPPAADAAVVLCPPFTALPAAAAALHRSPERAGDVALGAQNMYWEAEGAFTGEISARMLTDLGVKYVIVGHSERRQSFGETDTDARRKTAAALGAGITPIVAVGESLAVRDAGRAHEHVVAQTRAALEGLEADAVRRLVLAYEPIWAIGTGKNCAPKDAADVMAAMRACLESLADVPILYGGSVKADNIAAYMRQPDIDGALVGGASLDPSAFASIARDITA